MCYLNPNKISLASDDASNTNKRLEGFFFSLSFLKIFFTVNV